MTSVFSNLSTIRTSNERLLELFIVRQREQLPTIHTIGDIFLHAASEFRSIYAEYLSRILGAEKELEEATAEFPELKVFLERAAHTPEARGRDLKRFLNRPAAQYVFMQISLLLACRQRSHSRRYPFLVHPAGSNDTTSSSPPSSPRHLATRSTRSSAEKRTTRSLSSLSRESCSASRLEMEEDPMSIRAGTTSSRR
jgi:hypothetical protein